MSTSYTLRHGVNPLTARSIPRIVRLFHIHGSFCAPEFQLMASFPESALCPDLPSHDAIWRPLRRQQMKRRMGCRGLQDPRPIRKDKRSTAAPLYQTSVALSGSKIPACRTSGTTGHQPESSRLVSVYIDTARLRWTPSGLSSCAFPISRKGLHRNSIAAIFKTAASRAGYPSQRVFLRACALCSPISHIRAPGSVSADSPSSGQCSTSM
jgi:hypothetical protein